MDVGKTKMRGSVYGDLRFPPREDFKSEVKTYQMSKEDIDEKYGHLKGSGKKPTMINLQDGSRNKGKKKNNEEVNVMEKKWTKEKTVELARKYGTDMEGKKKIAKKMESTVGSVGFYFTKFQVLQELEKEKAEQMQVIKEEWKDIDEKQEQDNKTLNAEDVSKVLFDLAKEERCLKPEILKSTRSKFTYKIKEKTIVVIYGLMHIEIGQGEQIDNLISDLQEIKTLL